MDYSRVYAPPRHVAYRSVDSPYAELLALLLQDTAVCIADLWAAVRTDRILSALHRIGRRRRIHRYPPIRSRFHQDLVVAHLRRYAESRPSGTALRFGETICEIDHIPTTVIRQIYKHRPI